MWLDWDLPDILVKMEFIKDDSEDMSDAEACRVKAEDRPTEEQIGWWVFNNQT